MLQLQVFLLDITHLKTKHFLLIEGIIIGDLMKTNKISISANKTSIFAVVMLRLYKCIGPQRRFRSMHIPDILVEPCSCRMAS